MEAKDIETICNQILGTDVGDKSIVLNVVIKKDETMSAQSGDLLGKLGGATGYFLQNSQGYDSIEMIGPEPVYPQYVGDVPIFGIRIPVFGAKFGYKGKKIFAEAFKQSYTPEGNFYFQFLTHRMDSVDAILGICRQPRYAVRIETLSYASVESPNSADQMQVIRALNQGREKFTAEDVQLMRDLTYEQNFQASDSKLDIALEILADETPKLSRDFGLDCAFMVENGDMMFPAKKIYSLVLAAPYIGQFGILSVRASTDFSDKAYKGFIYWNLANVIFMQELFESIGNTDGFIHAQSNMRLGDKNARIDEVAMRVFGKIDEIAQFRTEYDILEKARSPPQNVMAYNREYLQRLHELGAEELYRKLEPVLSK